MEDTQLPEHIQLATTVLQRYDFTKVVNSQHEDYVSLIAQGLQTATSQQDILILLDQVFTRGYAPHSATERNHEIAHELWLSLTLDQHSILELMKTYLSHGRVMAGELCLVPPKALELLDDLAALQCGVLGVTCWRGSSREHIREDLSNEFDVSTALVEGSITPEQSCTIIKKHIQTTLMHFNYLSFILDVPAAWDREIVRSNCSE